MSTLLKIVGIGWAILGAANIIFMPGWTQTGHEGTLTIGLLINTAVFIFPGLGLYGIGAMIAKRKAATVTVPEKGQKKCPACAEFVKADATICRYCRNPLTASTVQAAAQ